MEPNRDPLTAAAYQQVETAKNGAANGRLIVALIALANVMTANPLGVVSCAVPLCLAYLADCAPERAGRFLSMAAVVSTLALLISAAINAG